MFNADFSYKGSIAQQLQGKSIEDVIALFEEHARTAAQALAEKDQIIVQRDKLIAQTSDDLQNTTALNEKLTFELSYLKRQRFGKKSEQLGGEQVELFEESRLADISAVEEEISGLGVQVTVPQHQRLVAKRQALPEHLPRTDIHHEVESTACGCGHALKRIGEDVSEKLDYVPGVFTVERHIRGKWACAHCQTLVQAPVPAQVIDKGIPTAGLLAQVIIAKHNDHLPLYRQEAIFERAGVLIPRSTLADWVGRSGVALQPLVDALRVEVLKHSVLHADETPVETLSPGDGKTHRSYIWAYAPGQFEDLKAVIFDFCESRSGEHARNFLGDWKGSLVTDDFSGYKALFTSGVEEVGCMAHARRKFFDLFASNKSPMAETALKFIQELYEIEREVQGLSPEERWNIRQSRGKPIAQKMHEWLINTRVQISDGSAGAKAMDYSLKRWDALIRYLDNAQLPIDNNKIENAIRPIANGRKNWLFAGSHRAGKRAVAAMSLIQSAKLNGHDPYLYLKDVLERLPTHKNHLIHELLPHNWKPQ